MSILALALLTTLINPPPVTLPTRLHGPWCWGEGSYVKMDFAKCPPPDRVSISATKIGFHEDECVVRSAVLAQTSNRRMPYQYHVTLWCRGLAVIAPQWKVESYWLGLWRGGNNLMMAETDDTFQPTDQFRFLREYPSD